MTTKEKRNDLRNYLKKEGLTQEKLAEILEVGQPHISNLFTGKTEFGKNQALDWEERFGIRAAWLLLGEGNMLKNSGTQTAINGNVIGVGSVAGMSGGKIEVSAKDSPEYIALLEENNQLREDNRRLLDQVIKLTDRLLQ